MQSKQKMDDGYSKMPLLLSPCGCGVVFLLSLTDREDVGVAEPVSLRQPLDNPNLDISSRRQQPNNIGRMGLVDYSDSDASDVEERPVAKPAAHSSKPAFQKVVDRATPGKIKISLPQTALKDDAKGDEPPTKRAKIKGGGFGGFSTLLPAPKRPGQSLNSTLGGGNAARKAGLGADVDLKTGAAPGFNREAEPGQEYADGLDEKQDEQASTGGRAGLSLPESVQDRGRRLDEEVKLVGKPSMFKPLSIARKPAKKKRTLPASVPSAATADPTISEPVTPQTTQKPPGPKVSLFSTGIELSSPAPASNGEYKSMIYRPEAEEAAEEAAEEDFDSSYPDPSYEEYTPTTTQTVPPAVPTPPVSQSLDDIAGDLNLSAAERRQLFGRQKGRNNGAQAATRIINFNTDQEYLHNEELRTAGEQVVRNPVRSIAPGKHSLKQLVNAVQNQKEALEESFAKGKSNRAEASSRYGW